MDDTALSHIRDALGMPAATLEQMCERIRTLRQTEMAIIFLLDRRTREAQARAAVDPGFLDSIHQEIGTRDKR